MCSHMYVFIQVSLNDLYIRLKEEALTNLAILVKHGGSTVIVSRDVDANKRACTVTRLMQGENYNWVFCSRRCAERVTSLSCRKRR